MKVNPNTIKQKQIENDDFFIIVNGDSYYRIPKNSIVTQEDLTQYAATNNPLIKVVNISAAEILTLGTAPVELLPAPNAYHYYDIDSIILESTDADYVEGVTPIGDFIKIVQGNLTYFTSTKLLLNGESCVALVKTSGAHVVAVDSLVVDVEYILTPSPVFMYLNDGVNPDSGTGTIRAIIKYRLREFNVTI